MEENHTHIPQDDNRAPDNDVGTLLQRLSNIESLMTEMSHHLSFIPPQVRSLSIKVDTLASTIAESRYRALLLRLLSLYDLATQLSINDTQEKPQLDLLRQQLSQTLTINGLEEIPAKGKFDPKWHQSVMQIPCDDPEQDGVISEVIRPGFYTEQSVLRFAEVVIHKYVLKPDET